MPEQADKVRSSVDRLRKSVTAALQAIVDALPRGCALVEVEEHLTRVEGDWRCVLRPAHVDARSSEVAVEIPDAGGVIYVGFGQDSRLEVFADEEGWRDDRFRSPVDQVRTIAEAIVAGGMTETTWVRGGVILKSRAVMALGDGPYEVSARHTLVPPWGSTCATVRFRAYCQPS